MMSNFAELVQPSRIAGSLYRDPDIFEAEIENIWNKVWVFVAHESEVRDNGSFVRRQIGRTPVIVVRSQDGIKVFENRCRHRANLLCHQEEGRVSRFVCPYHAWTYDLRGRLIGTSFSSGFGPDFDKRSFNLTEVARVESYRGFIFASLSPDGMTLDAHLGQVKEFIDLFCDLSPVGTVSLSAGSQKVQYRGNWKFMPENSLEGDHHGPFIHKIAFDLVAKRTGLDVSGLSSNEVPDVILSLPNGHMVEDYRAINLSPPEGRKSEAQREYASLLIKAHGETKASQLLRTMAPLIYVFPNMIYLMTHIRRIEPVSVSTTNAYYSPVMLDGAPPEINTRRLREHEFMMGPAGFVSPDDIEIMERNQMAVEARSNDWLYIGRGIHRENRRDGGGSGGLTMDENHLRGFWQHYLSVVAAQ